jgi:hypothetical protein
LITCGEGLNNGNLQIADLELSRSPRREIKAMGFQTFPGRHTHSRRLT